MLEILAMLGLTVLLCNVFDASLSRALACLVCDFASDTRRSEFSTGMILLVVVLLGMLVLVQNQPPKKVFIDDLVPEAKVASKHQATPRPHPMRKTASKAKHKRLNHRTAWAHS